MTRASLRLTGSLGGAFLISFCSFLRLFPVCLFFSHLYCHSVMADRGNTPGAVVNGLFGFNYTYWKHPVSLKSRELETLLTSWYNNDISQQLSAHPQLGTTVGTTSPCLPWHFAGSKALGHPRSLSPAPLHARRSGLRFCGTTPMFCLSSVFMGGPSSICQIPRKSSGLFYLASANVPSLALRYAALVPARTGFKPTL